MKDNHLIDTDPTDAAWTNRQKDEFLAALGYKIPPPLAGAAARLKRRQERETFTALLSCKPIDVELRRLKYAELRKRAGLKNKGKP